MTANELYKGDSFFDNVKWDVVSFTFTVQGSTDRTTDVFNPNTLSSVRTTAGTGLWVSGGLANFNTFTRGLFSAPKMIRRITINSSTNSYLSTPLSLLTLSANGTSITRPKMVGLSVSPYQYQSQADVNFKPNEFLLNNNNYISQYTFLGNTNVTWTIYYTELKQASFLARPFDTLMNRVLDDMGVEGEKIGEEAIAADTARQVFYKGIEPIRMVID